MNALPKTDSISELAEFWDTHDVTDFDEALEEVQGPVFQLREQLTIELPLADAQALHRLAADDGVTDSILVSRWVHEHVQIG